MSEFKSTEELREFILNRQDMDEDVLGISGHCWGLAWKKDRWVVRSNNKRVAEITSADVPEGFDMRTQEFSFNVLSALRKESIDGLNSYLKEINNVQ